MYNFIIYQIIQLILPVAKVKQSTLDFINSALAPMYVIYDEFTQFRVQKSLESKITSQVMVLEWYLNLVFGTSTIVIVDNNVIEDDVIVRKFSEDVDVPIVRNYSESSTEPIIRNYEEYDSEVDFFVDIPAILDDEGAKARIKSIVNLYVFAGKRYEIRIL